MNLMSFAIMEFLNSMIDPAMLILVVGALFTAGFIVSIISFYLDEYWDDADFRKELRYGKKEKG